MRTDLKTALKLGAALLLVGVTVAWVFARTARLRHQGEAVWFYDQSEKRLYPGNANTFPPDKGVGGKKDDGVRAIVVSFPGARKDSRIAYLQTCTPELKNALERARAARTTGKPFNAQLLSRDSDFFQTNTLVRRPEETTWHASNTAEAQRILSAWRSWQGPNGQSPMLCVPE